jgi:hypothetical protein
MVRDTSFSGGFVDSSTLDHLLATDLLQLIDRPANHGCKDENKEASREVLELQLRHQWSLHFHPYYMYPILSIFLCIIDVHSSKISVHHSAAESEFPVTRSELEAAGLIMINCDGVARTGASHQSPNTVEDVAPD